MSLTLGRFIGIVIDVAQEKHQHDLVVALKRDGSECRLFENGHLDSFGMVEFVLVLEEKLATVLGVSRVCIPDHELEYGQKVSELYRIACNLQGIIPSYVEALEIA